MSGSALALLAGCIGGSDDDEPTDDDSEDDTGTTDDTSDDPSDTDDVPASGDDGDDAAPDDSAIPETAIHHWRMDERHDDTVVDHIGGADGTVHGPLETVSGDWRGGYAEYAAPASNAHIDLGTPEPLANAISDRSITIFATVQPDAFTPDTSMTILGAGGGESNWFEFRLSNSDGGYTGQPMILIRDSVGDTVRTVADDPIELETPTRIVTQVSGDTAADVAFWIDGERADSTSLSDDAASGSIIPDQSYGLFASNPQSADTVGTRRYFAGILDDVIVCDAPVTESEIVDDYTAR